MQNGILEIIHSILLMRKEQISLKRDYVEKMRELSFEIYHGLLPDCTGFHDMDLYSLMETLNKTKELYSHCQGRIIGYEQSLYQFDYDVVSLHERERKEEAEKLKLKRSIKADWNKL